MQSGDFTDVSEHILEKGRRMFSRETVLVACLFVSFAGGSVYGFGIISEIIKTTLNLSQTRLQTLALMMNLGNYVPLVSGMMVDFFGLRVGAIVGGALNVLGYGFVWHGVWSAKGNFYAFCFFFALIGHASNWLDVTAMGGAVKNFPEQRGLAVGLIKAFYGIGASILSQIAATWFSSDTVALILFFGIGLSAFAALSAPFLAVLPPQQEFVKLPTLRRLQYGCVVLVLTALYLYILSLLTSKIVGLEFSHKTRVACFIGLCFIVALIFFIPLSRLPLLVDVPVSQAAWEAEARQVNPTQVESRPLQTVRTLNFWLLMGVVLGVQAAGLTCLNNVAQIVLSLNGTKSDEGVCVSLMSIANALGRMSFGLGSDRFANRIHRTLFLPILVGGMCLAYVFLIFSSLKTVYLALFFVGFFYGGSWCLQPAVTSELFGLKNFASNYSIFSSAPAVGSLLFSTYIASTVYDSHKSPGTSTCVGHVCYRLTFEIILAFNCFSFILAAILAARTKLYYERLQVSVVDALPDDQNGAHVQSEPTDGFAANERLISSGSRLASSSSKS